MRLAEQLADLRGCFWGDIGNGSFDRFPMLRMYTDHSAKSENYEINTPEQGEPAVFDDRGRMVSLRQSAEGCFIGTKLTVSRLR